MAIIDGQVILAADIPGGWGMNVADITASAIPTGTLSDVAGLTFTRTVGSTAEEFRVDVILTGVATANQSRLVGILNVDGVLQVGSIFLGNNSTPQVNGNIEVGSMVYRVTGLAPGSRVFKVQASQTGSAWTLAANSCRISSQRVK